jgi:hypothetical protein
MICNVGEIDVFFFDSLLPEKANLDAHPATPPTVLEVKHRKREADLSPPSVEINLGSFRSALPTSLHILITYWRTFASFLQN